MFSVTIFFRQSCSRGGIVPRDWLQQNCSYCENRALWLYAETAGTASELSLEYCGFI